MWTSISQLHKPCKILQFLVAPKKACVLVHHVEVTFVTSLASEKRELNAGGHISLVNFWSRNWSNYAQWVHVFVLRKMWRTFWRKTVKQCHFLHFNDFLRKVQLSYTFRRKLRKVGSVQDHVPLVGVCSKFLLAKRADWFFWEAMYRNMLLWQSVYVHNCIGIAIFNNYK